MHPDLSDSRKRASADARLAADTGADVLIVSNHDGRQLDGALSSIDALPGIVDAVRSRIEVWLTAGSVPARTC